MEWDDQPSLGCNPFLLLGGELSESPRRRLYAVLDQAEIDEEGRHHLTFSAVDADWFDNPPEGVLQARDLASLYAAMPIYLFDVRLGADGIRKIASSFSENLEAVDQQPSASPVGVAALSELLEDLERRWKRFELGDGEGGIAADLYRNLFADPEPVVLARVQETDVVTSTRLTATDPLSGEPDASIADIKDALQGISAGIIDHVAVYDVGQGGANGLVDQDGSVLAYFDFGGGCAGNKATFPSKNLKQFCFCHGTAPPTPIVLSHWDHDHWSSQGRDKRAHRRTWIAPRQTVHRTKRGFHHSALIASIKRHGKLLIWPAGTTSITVGRLTLLECTGTSRNASGLAAEIKPPDEGQGRPAILPADAGYADLPSPPASTSFDFIACPHHGGRSNSPSVPAHPGGVDQRLAYSYGHGNSYKHPLPATYTAHDSAGWLDSRVTPSPPHHVLNTEKRAPSGLGHIGFDWGMRTLPWGLPCNGACQLEVEQI